MQRQRRTALHGVPLAALGWVLAGRGDDRCARAASRTRPPPNPSKSSPPKMWIVVAPLVFMQYLTMRERHLP